jgi:REP-associated tyrosine transposase
MPRQSRLEFKGAIHFVRVRGGRGLSIFFDPGILKPGGPPPHRSAPDLHRFERLMTAARQGCQVVLHGYSVEPNSATLVLQTAGAPLEAFMRRLCGQYSRYLHSNGRLPGQRCAFAARYESKVIAPEYLPHAVRRAHRAPIIAGHCRSRMDYPFSSERAYMGERAALPFEAIEVRKALELRGLFGARGYREFMEQSETPYVAELFDSGAPLDSRIVGGKLYVKQVRLLATHPPTAPTREQIIGGVARLMNQPEAEIRSSSHAGALCRALVAWYALRSGTSTLSGVGQWFSVTGATLGQGIRHYRRVAPQLFDLAELPRVEATPGAQDPGQVDTSDDADVEGDKGD